MQEAFQYLKEELNTPPVLSFPYLDFVLVVETSGSSAATRVVISQKTDDGKVHLVQFASRMMTEQEHCYTTSEQ